MRETGTRDPAGVGVKKTIGLRGRGMRNKGRVLLLNEKSYREQEPGWKPKFHRGRWGGEERVFSPLMKNEEIGKRAKTTKKGGNKK